MVQYASLVPSGFQATDSSHGHGEPAVFFQLWSVVVDLPLSASHTSTRESPSERITVSSTAVTIPTRLPSAVTANSRTYRFSAITFSIFPLPASSRNTSETFRLPEPYSGAGNFVRSLVKSSSSVALASTE